MPAVCWTAGNLDYSQGWTRNTSYTRSFPTGYSTGNLLLMFVGSARHDFLPSSPATPSGWTRIHEHTVGVSTGGPDFLHRYVVFGKVIDGTEGGSVTLTGINVDGSGSARNRGTGVDLVWIDAKLNGDEQGGWFDDWAAVADTTLVPSLDSSRTDNVYLFHGMGLESSSLSAPSGMCGVKAKTGEDHDTVIATERINYLGATGSRNGTGTGADHQSAFGCLIPANPYAWPPRPPVVGFIGWVGGEPTVVPPPVVDRVMEDGTTTRHLEDGVTPRTLE